MTILREWPIRKDKQRVGPLVTPWQLFGADLRIVTLFGHILSSTEGIAMQSVPFLAEDVFGSLILLAQESNEPVKIIINNGGGSLEAGFIIVQAMEHLKKKGIEVTTLAIGAAKSMATTILTMGTKGKRYAMPRSVIHVHSTSYGEQGKDQDVEEINRFHRRLSIDLYRLLAQETKLPEYHVVHSELEPKDQKWSGKEEMRIKFVQALLLKEVYLTPEQALEAGIIDDILAPGDPRIDDIFKATSGGAK